uniref:Uncharacterized protein n=1 Tax=Knipowitschia caucasica TaxID=637954 RepID=A0AAV2JVQ8_KNICA
MKSGVSPFVNCGHTKAPLLPPGLWTKAANVSCRLPDGFDFSSEAELSLIVHPPTSEHQAERRRRAPSQHSSSSSIIPPITLEGRVPSGCTEGPPSSHAPLVRPPGDGLTCDCCCFCPLSCNQGSHKH